MIQSLSQQSFTLNSKKISVIEALTTKYYELTNEQNNFRLVSKNDLGKFFDDQELQIIDELYQIDAKQLGFMGEFIGIDEVPTNLIEIPPQPITVAGDNKDTGTHFLPKGAKQQLDLIQIKMKSDGVGKVLVNSAYRSPSYQALLFLSNLRRNEYDIIKTASRVALPGYSEHGSATSPAVDFITSDGIPNSANPLGFEATEQFKWLSKYAGQYSFYLSYPKGNKLGVIFEPWHWRYIPKT